MTLDSVALAAFQVQVATLMRNESRYLQIVGEKDSQLKMYADNERVLRKRIKRQKLSGFIAYFIAIGAGFLAISK